MRLLPESRRAAIALLLITAALALCTVQFTLHVSGSIQHFVVYWLYNGLVIAAGLVCIARGIATKRERAAWLLIGSAVVCWGVGNTIWTFVYVHLDSPPYPSIADAFWLAIYPPVYIAIVLLLNSRAGRVRRSLWLDGVIGSLAVAGVGTAVVFQAVLNATSGSKAAVATNLSYPLADLTLIALVVWVVALSGWRIGRAWGLIAAGLLVFSISDCLYLFQTAVGSYVAGGATDLGWLGGSVLLAWAAWQPSQSRIRARLEGWVLLLAPVGFGLLALAVLVYDHFRAVNELSLVLATAAIIAVIARMALTFAENMKMLAGSRHEARTDMLTGLGNRRRLLDDLGTALGEAATPSVLVLFDLNGFKQYNDSFGHPAGDALLARLGHNLARFVTGRGSAYRMGGDEFCIVCAHDVDGEVLAEGAAHALAERGEGFTITAAYGAVFLPAEATSASDALRIADQRMYAHKQGTRGSASEQSSGVLLQALSERHPKLGDHVVGVAELAEAVAVKLELPQEEVGRVRLAAYMHDVGKMAIPDAILEKRGPVSDEESKFLHTHTVIGERILQAAPALAHVAGIVRSSHERFDGSGYPDGLAGTDIPLASRIVFVCDAFDAMTSISPYSDAVPVERALAELEQCAGTQFDPVVVAAFAAVLADKTITVPRREVDGTVVPFRPARAGGLAG
jgi:two-component system, cell cycle response regulator